MAYWNVWFYYTLLVLSVFYLILGIDDLIIDFMRWRKSVRPQELTDAMKKELFQIPEKKIAILIPAWKESEIISEMLMGNIQNIKFENYHFFVGVYPNDLPTFRAVCLAAKETSKVTPVVNFLPGPTSKGQILNYLLSFLNEQETGKFDAYLFHDAEDIIHPLSLKLINFELEFSDVVQLPVFSLPIEETFSVGALYMDEFAVVQTREMLVRESMKSGLPSSGVGFAISHRALKSMEGADEAIFVSNCLTEDYLFGLRAAQGGLKQSFPCFYESGENQIKNWIATFEYFPRKLLPSVRQKARWIQGIVLQASESLGWFGGYVNEYFLFRDRKSLMAHTLGLLGLFCIPVGLVSLESFPQDSWLRPLLGLNFGLLVNRLRVRIQASYLVYGKADLFASAYRFILGVLVNGLAAIYALRNHLSALLAQKPPQWQKTTHELPVGFGVLSRQSTKVALLLTLFASLSFAESRNPCLQIFYDKPTEESSYRFFGRIHALFVENLMGHFPHWNQSVSPIQDYKKGLLERCEASIYLGTDFHQKLPQDFLIDFEKGDRPFLWAGYHLWQLDKRALGNSLGVEFAGLTALDFQSKDKKGRPHFFKWHHYKGEVFEKYGEFDRKDPTRFNAAFEISRLTIESPRTEVIAWAEHSGTAEKLPYVIRKEKRWYVADSPFSFITEKDRYLIFTDLLFDLLNEKPRYQGKRPALVRFEDIHPNIPLWQLDAYLQIFKQSQIPFSLSLIPIFADPLLVQTDDRSERVVTIAQKKFFQNFLREAENWGGSIILHGITHQYRDIRNPFNGMSGDDFEFWDGVNQKPLPEDSVSYVLSRLETGWDLVRSSGFEPVAWLTPHYQASPLDFVLFGQLSHWNMGRVVYFPFEIKNFVRLPAPLALSVSGKEHREERLRILGNLEVTYPQELKPNGQFFPFEIWGDVFGQRLIPENLGNIQPFLNEQVHKTQRIEDMIECARRNRVLRDHWASFFIHPVLIQPTSEEGIADYPGEGDKLVSFFQTIEELGYEFIDLKKWIRKQPLLLKNERQPQGTLQLNESLANETLAPPEVLLEKAKKGRTEFVEVIGDIQRLAPGLEAKEALFPYIALLNDLKKVEETNGIAEIGENLVRSLGYTLTRNGVKWLRLDVDSDEVLKNFFFWSENSTRYQFAGLHIKLLVLKEGKEELIRFFEKATPVITWIEDLKSEAYVEEAFEQLQANCLQRLMKIRDQLRPEEMEGLLKQTKSYISIQSVLSFLNEEGLKTTNLEDLETYLSWVGILGKNLQALREVIPFYALAAPGQLITTLILKFLTVNYPFNAKWVSPSLEVLLPSQIPSLGSSILMLFKDKTIPHEILDVLFELSSQLLEKYRELNLGNETNEMRKFASQIVLLQASRNNQVEGSYEVTLRDKPGLVNLIHLGNGKFFMGISVRYGGEVSVDFSFFHITFNNKKQIWEAAHYEPNDPVTSNPVNEVFFTEFQISPEEGNNKIKGTLFTAKLTSPYQGKQTRKYIEYVGEPAEKIKEVGGVFTGNEGAYQFRLLIFQVEQRLQGVILVTSPGRIPVNVDLEYGYYDPRKNVAYLTSGRFESFRWVQIRGQFSDQGRKFEGQYIQSVYGVIHQLSLTRQEGESSD